MIAGGTAATASMTGGLVINGVTVSTTTAQNIAEVLAAINQQTANTGVSASRATSNVNSAMYQQGFSGSTVEINGVAIDIAAMSTATQAAAAMNAVREQTGVTVAAAGNRLSFSSRDGADFTVTDDPDITEGVLSNYNGLTVSSGESASFTAGIVLSSPSLTKISVQEGTGTTANDMQLLSPGVDVSITSTLGSVVESGGSQSVSNAAIGSAVASGGSLTFDQVIIDTLVVSGGSVTLTNSIVRNIVISGGSINATGSYLGSTISSGGSIGNSAPVAGGSPSTSATQALRVSSLDISSVEGAANALRTVDLALQQVNAGRAKLGALQARFENTVSTLQLTSENLSVSRGRIQDADFALETAMLSKSQILQQAGTAMVAQANQMAQSVLTLLR